jgi:hypothetical protein
VPDSSLPYSHGGRKVQAASTTDYENTAGGALTQVTDGSYVGSSYIAQPSPRLVSYEIILDTTACEQTRI